VFARACACVKARMRACVGLCARECVRVQMCISAVRAFVKAYILYFS
jgi:hypothetical protein